MAVNYKRIGKRIQQIRKMKMLSQSDLAEMVGMSSSYISHIETAIKKASLESIVHISNALGVTVDQLLNGNQTNDRNAYKSEFYDLISDCNAFERSVIYDVAAVVKKSLREHEDIYPHDDSLGKESL